MDGTVRLSVSNFLVIGLIAVVFIVAAKVVFAKVEVPGVSDVVAAV